MRYFNIDSWVMFESKRNHPWSGMPFQVSEVRNIDGVVSYTLKFGNRLVLANSDEVKPLRKVDA